MFYNIHVYKYLTRRDLFTIYSGKSQIKGGMQAKGIWKQDPEVSIWDQEGREWGVEKAPQWGTS